MYYLSIHEQGGNVQAKLPCAIKRNIVASAPWEFPGFTINHRHLSQTSTNFFLLMRHIALLLPVAYSCVVKMKTRWTSRADICLEQFKKKGWQYSQVWQFQDQQSSLIKRSKFRVYKENFNNGLLKQVIQNLCFWITCCKTE